MINLESKQVRQLNLIIMLVQSSVPVTFKKIKQNIEAYQQSNSESARKMFERDKNELRELGIQISKVEQCKYYIDKNLFYLPEINLNGEELYTLSLIISLILKSRTDLPFSNQLSTALSKIEISNRINEENEISDYTFILNQFMGNESDHKNIKTVLNAIIRRQRLRIKYSPAQPDDYNSESIRQVDPLGLICRMGIFYLIGYCHKRKGIRIFNTHRIEEVKRKTIYEYEKPFFIPHTFRLSDYTNLQPWELGNEFPYQATLVFKKDIAWYIQKKYSNDCNMKTLKNGNLKMTINVQNTHGLIEFVLSFGEKCELQKPLKARDILRHEIRECLNIYNDFFEAEIDG